MSGARLGGVMRVGSGGGAVCYYPSPCSNHTSTAGW